MKNLCFTIVILLFFVACKNKVENIKATQQNITESVYASGVVKAENQYQVYATVNGIIQTVFANEGDIITANSPLILIKNETQKLNAEIAQLASSYNNIEANTDKLNDLKININLAKNKLLNDSSLYSSQQNLWNNNIGTKNDLDQRYLAFQNSKTIYESVLLKYADLKRQLNFASQQANKNFLIANKQLGDFIIKSEIEGKVYSILKKKGELVNTQTPLAIIGSANKYLLELQIDEYDIIKIKKGQLIFISLDSYKGEVYEATVSKINPIMNERTKTFTIEAIFTKQPITLFPNLTVEANIVIETKKNALTLPRNIVSDDGFVTNKNGTKIAVKTGLKDYNKIEIIEGITANDELIETTK